MVPKAGKLMIKVALLGGDVPESQGRAGNLTDLSSSSRKVIKALLTPPLEPYLPPLSPKCPILSLPVGDQFGPPMSTDGDILNWTDTNVPGLSSRLALTRAFPVFFASYEKYGLVSISPWSFWWLVHFPALQWPLLPSPDWWAPVSAGRLTADQLECNPWFCTNFGFILNLCIAGIKAFLTKAASNGDFWQKVHFHTWNQVMFTTQH